MTSNELKAVLAELGVSLADFARLIGVTPRAVSLWIGDERAIPGPAEAYLRLFRLLPSNLRQVELARLKQKGTTMRDGMYRITFQAQQGAGMGVLIFDNGRVYGADSEGTRIDGEYIVDERTGLANVTVKITFRANAVAVFGISNPYEWSIDVTTTLDPKQTSGALHVMTSIGRPLAAQYAFLRELPEAARAG